jgi:sugar O-acyltransferase (sialic acid O-acetyltransferase NeuD family)
MPRSFCITGQSNFGVAVLLDTLSALFPHELIQVDIVANIPAHENDSLVYPYDCQGIDTSELYYADWQPGAYDGYFVGSIGKSRRAIVAFFQERFGLKPDQYLPLIHPSAVCSPSVVRGHGIHISPLSVVAPHAALGNFVVINRQASIGHHTRLDDFVTINPGVTVAGCCDIGEGVILGAGATVLDKITIGAGSIIGAGSVVTRAIPEGVVAFGAPARVIRSVL